MKTTLDLLNEVVEMGFNRTEALESIDASLDNVFGFENRKEIRDEELSDEFYNDILDGFKCEPEKSNDYADKPNTNTTDKEKNDMLIKTMLLHMFRNN